MIETHTFNVNNPRPIRIWTDEIENYEEINKKILDIISQHRADNPAEITDSINVNMWQTDWNMENTEGFSDIAKHATKMTREIAVNILNYKKWNSKIVDCWANVGNKDSRCNVHSHFPATFSIVYYVSVPSNSGKIFFPDIPVQLTPAEGLMICFEGGTWHGVENNLTDQDRIIVAMNIIYNEVEK